MARMSTSELKALLQAEKADALSSMQSSKLSEERSKAMEYYLGNMEDMPSLPDRSRAVSTDVADTVEGLMPQLMEIFFAGDDVVEFQPVGPEDEEAAAQETDYINHVFQQKNEGFLTGYTMMKDALLSKNGIAKVWWEEEEREEVEERVGLDDEALGVFLMEHSEADGWKIVSHEEREADANAY